LFVNFYNTSGMAVKQGVQGMKTQREELLNWLVEFLNKKIGSYYDARGLFEQKLKIQDRALLDSILEELIQYEWIKTGEDKYMVSLSYKGRELLEKHGSYSGFSNSQRWRKRIITCKNTLTAWSTIITTISTVGMFIFAGLAYKSDNENDRLEKINNELKQKIDSLSRKEVPKTIKVPPKK